ncbi:MAG: DNA polymerase III subunit epsilon [Fibrobacter sp.]|nr:DNA polymerase III subunit epsilon [Fibrobacter sp.]
MNKIPAFVAVDLETTGLEFEKDEIIEVALVRFENGAPVDSVDYLVRPESAKLRPFIESLTGISNEDIAGAEDFASLAGKISAFVGDMPLVAHNAMFDSRFLKNALEKVGIPFNNPVWDSLTLSRIAYQDVPNHRLDTLTQVLNIERSRAHRALPDAEACGKLFVMAYEKIASLDPWLLGALTRIASCSDWKLLFGESTEGEIAEPALALRAGDTPAGALAASKAPRVDAFFKEGGLLSKTMENFKARPNQQEFASCVERNLYKGGICVLEAPTGSGKSLAYLVAAANKAVSGERVVISTATHALQEQLIGHDIPQIAPLYDGKLKASVLKGRDNYLCVRKLMEILNAPATLLLPEERDSFMALLPWAVTTEKGDIGECNSFSCARNRVLWSKLSSTAASCVGESCKYHAVCPALKAKREAMASNLLLVNHSLFLADLALDFALLPTYEHVVFDEAHRLPELSNQSFGRTVSFFRFRNVAKTLVPPKGTTGGIVPELENRIPVENEAARSECTQLAADIGEAEKAIHRFFMKIGKKLSKQKVGKGDLIYRNGIAADFDADPKNVIDQFALVQDRAKSLMELVAGLPSIGGLLKDFSGRMEELKRYATDFEFLVKAGREGWVFYMEEPFNPHTIKIHAVPLRSGDIWKEKFYPWVKSATFTSATLAVQGDLSYYAQRMGMSELEQKRPFLKAFGEAFASDERRTVQVARYLPKPSLPEFGDALNNTLVQVLPEVEENTMVLFTSISAMMKAQAALAPEFAAKGKLLLCQHVDGSLDGLIAMFRKSRGACLLGCQSLWEGVDFPGDALKLLVVTKLPFPNPSDPLVAGISADLKAKGENVFKSYYIPEAYMELRQGLGRLLRTESDSGKVLILDNRVVTEAYGKTFARIWNMKHVTANSVDDVKKFVK